ncbi:MAG: hypothetical protein OHK93_004630 [Ramalina farinacea]|uniref:Uncharacterized protein n=1 Tax=Ramalina farinacea TaxID=258253 RepID=A0AA43QV40_9LECA|nr:hypothetical protein [Ramalina farinacea]
MPPKKRESKALGKRKRQHESPEAEDQTQAQDLAPSGPHSTDEATTERLRRAYPFLTHTRQAFVEGTSAHVAAISQTSFPTQDEIAEWKSKGGHPADYPTRQGNLAEWLREVAAMQPLLRPNTQRARAIAKARAEVAAMRPILQPNTQRARAIARARAEAEAEAEAVAEAEAQQSDADTETTSSTDETASQIAPGALPSKAKRNSRETTPTSDEDAEEEEVELSPSVARKARQARPRGSAYSTRKTGKEESPPPIAKGKVVKSKVTPTKWVTLRLRQPGAPMPRIPGLNYKVKKEVASELIENVEEDPAYDSEETTDDHDLIEMKDATSILMSMAADEEAGRQIEEAKILLSMAADQQTDRQVGATSEHEAAEPLIMVSESSGNSPDAVEGVEHSAGGTDEQQDPGVQFAPAPVRVTFNLAHAPSTITNRPPKQQNESLLGPPAVDERGRAAKSKKRKYEEIEET